MQLTVFSEYTDRHHALELIRAYRTLEGTKLYARPTGILGQWFIALVTTGHHDGGRRLTITAEWKRNNPTHCAILAR